jgi:hypothetical protein
LRGGVRQATGDSTAIFLLGMIMRFTYRFSGARAAPTDPEKSVH